MTIRGNKIIGRESTTRLSCTQGHTRNHTMYTKTTSLTSPTSMSTVPIIMVIYTTFMDEIDTMVMAEAVTLDMEVLKDIAMEKTMASKPLGRRTSAR